MEEQLASPYKGISCESIMQDDNATLAVDADSVQQLTLESPLVIVTRTLGTRYPLSPNEPHKCQHCGRCFGTSSHLAIHNRIHTGQRYECQTCGKCFGRTSDLARHNRTHSGEKPYKCQQCGKCFVSSSYLSNHNRIHISEKPFKCQQCGKCFVLPSGLARHNRTHSSDKPYKLQQCDKCFFIPSELAHHNRIHTGEKPYKCQQCSKSFGAPRYLWSHIRIHSGEKPYKCNQCGKFFGSASSLAMHNRRHSGDKPYKCMQCGKCFLTSSELASHNNRIHPCQKLYECQQCGKCFGTSSHLARHNGIHSENTKKEPLPQKDESESEERLQSSDAEVNFSDIIQDIKERINYEPVHDNNFRTKGADNCGTETIPNSQSGFSDMSYKCPTWVAEGYEQMKNHENKDFLQNVRENIEEGPLSEDEKLESQDILEMYDAEVNYSDIIDDIQERIKYEPVDEGNSLTKEADNCGARIIPGRGIGCTNMPYQCPTWVAEWHEESIDNEDFDGKVRENIKKEPLSEDV